MKYNSGFLNGMKGIFEDKNNNDNRKKTRKKRKSLLDQVVGIFKDDESREVNHNAIISNTKPTHCQKGVTKKKSPYKNKDIKYKNNKKRAERKKNLECKRQEKVIMKTVQRRRTMIAYQVYKVVTDLIVIKRWIIELILKRTWILKVMVDITKPHML